MKSELQYCACISHKQFLEIFASNHFELSRVVNKHNAIFDVFRSEKIGAQMTFC